jgi:DNA-directed RNA polymerase specialized sigma24 family protein
VSSGPAPLRRSTEQVSDAIRGLSPADWARLRKVAHRYAFGRPIEPLDLLQEALFRAISTRTCPDHVDVVRFLAEAMRSIAHGESEKAVLELVSIAKSGEAGGEFDNLPDHTPGPEACMISAEHAEMCEQVCVAIRSLFDDDPIAKDILDGLSEGFSAEEIRELTGLDKTAYDSKRKLIRRRIDKHYPQGWKP